MNLCQQNMDKTKQNTCNKDGIHENMNGTVDNYIRCSQTGYENLVKCIENKKNTSNQQKRDIEETQEHSNCLLKEIPRNKNFL